jgi:hypothetical protein
MAAGSSKLPIKTNPQRLYPPAKNHLMAVGTSKLSIKLQQAVFYPLSKSHHKLRGRASSVWQGH